MRLNKILSQRKFGVFIITFGVTIIFFSILITPTFASKYLSQDHNITVGTIKQLNISRFIMSLGGILMIIIGIILTSVENIWEKPLMLFLMKKIKVISVLGFKLQVQQMIAQRIPQKGF